ncbi:MAG: hypothetical protein FJY82_05290 [Candidatus Aminicenantes bacterium]|nr:hypothetical protein [Candidatus Aminicenantes bacterium]
MTFIFFSDLDETLLDRGTYDWGRALPGLNLLKKKGIPLILMTSKTLEETVEFLEEMEVEDAFSVENGGAAFIPRSRAPEAGDDIAVKTGSYVRKVLGTPLSEILAFYRDFLEKHDPPFRAMTDMTLDEVVETTGLPAAMARKALARSYDLPFWAGPGSEDHLRRLAGQASRKGLSVVSGGRFHHLKGAADKGTAFDAIRPHYPCDGDGGPVRTVGLGDSENDASFLAKADLPVIIRRLDGTWDPRLAAALPKALRTETAGPAGWAEAVFSVLSPRR